MPTAIAERRKTDIKEISKRRKAVVHSVRGRFSHVKTSSDEYAKRKHSDTAREAQRS